MTPPLLMWLVVVAAEPLLLDRVVATVDYQVVTESELQARTMLALRLAQVLAPAEQPQLKSEVLYRLIEERLIFAEAKRIGIRFTERELDLFMDEVARAEGTTPSETLARARLDGITPLEYRLKMRFRLTEKKWLEREGGFEISSVTQAGRAAFLRRNAIGRQRFIDTLRGRSTIEIVK